MFSKISMAYPHTKAIKAILDYVEGIQYASLTPEVVTYVKIHFLDTLGAIFAGSKARCSKELLSLIKKWGGVKEATVLVYGYKTTLPFASWINSTMSRGFDYEPILMGGATHVPASIIPAALNLAEYAETVRKKRVTGKDLILSTVIGLDLNWRLRVAGTGRRKTGMGSGWLAETFSPIAIAALGGRLLGFTREKINYAMAIAFSQSCGHYGATVGKDGGLMAQLSQGLGTKNGILAVLLAEKGLKAAKDIIDGRWGLYVLFGGGSYDPKKLLGELGVRFDHLRPYIKRYPGCGALQAPLEATLRIAKRKDADLRPENISEIRVKMDALAYQLVAEGKGNSLPQEGDALWDCYYAVALGLKKKKVSIEDFTEEGIKKSGVSEIISKVRVICDEERKGGMNAEVEIETKDGYMISEKVENLDSLEWQELLEKFESCCDIAVRKLTRTRREKIIKAVEDLENLDSVSKLIKLATIN